MFVAMLEHHMNCDTVGPNGAPGVFRVSTSWISGAVRAQVLSFTFTLTLDDALSCTWASFWKILLCILFVEMYVKRLPTFEFHYLFQLQSPSLNFTCFCVFCQI